MASLCRLNLCAHARRPALRRPIAEELKGEKNGGPGLQLFLSKFPSVRAFQQWQARLAPLATKQQFLACSCAGGHYASRGVTKENNQQEKRVSNHQTSKPPSHAASPSKFGFPDANRRARFGIRVIVCKLLAGSAAGTKWSKPPLSSFPPPLFS